MMKLETPIGEFTTDSYKIPGTPAPEQVSGAGLFFQSPEKEWIA